MAASNWFAIIMIPAAVMTGCSSPATDENAQTSTKRAVPPVSSSQAMIENAAWMNLTNGQIQALADQALSCDGNVHRIVKCPPGPRKARAAWVDFDRNHPLSFDSINLSFEVSKQGLAAEPLARIPPEPIRLVRFFFPDWRGGAAWLRYAVKHSQGQCPMQARLADADLSVIGQYRHDPRNETEGFIVELRIYRRSAHAERLLDQCVREEVTDSSEIRSHALVNGMSVEEALKLERTDQGS